MDGRVAATRPSYDRVADEYAARRYDELVQKPFDRDFLDRLVARVGNLGPTSIESERIAEALREIRRAVGRAVSLDFHFFEVAAILSALDSAGFDHAEVFERGPYEGVEVATQRAYIFALRGDDRG